MTLTIDPKHPIGSGTLLWLVSGRIPGSDDDTAQLVLAPTDDDARDTFTDWMINSSNMDEETEESLRADHGTACYIITCEQIGQAGEAEPVREPVDDGEPAENSYVVRWEVDVEADSPRLAAQQAADDYFQGRIGAGEPDTACVFSVTDTLTNETTIVDLAKPED
jgi:hypothetical protein